MNDFDPGQLDDDVRDLISQARDMHEPTSFQQARVRRALEANVAAGVVSVVAASTAAASTGKIVVAAVVAIGMASTGVWMAKRESHPAQPKPAATHVVHEAPKVIAPEPPPPPAVEEPVLPEKPAPRPQPRHVQETLARETLLLRRVNAAINRGQGSEALKLLKDYDRKFKDGMLLEERSAAGILALCLAGRDQAAHAQAERFLARWPRSPLVGRVSASCALSGQKPQK